jgi:hypothetical protein
MVGGLGAFAQGYSGINPSGSSCQGKSMPLQVAVFLPALDSRKNILALLIPFSRRLG